MNSQEGQVEQAPVVDIVRSIAGSLERLDNSVAQLTSKLSPVLAEGTDGMSEPEQPYPPCSSPMGANLVAITSHITLIQGSINSLLSRLEIY